MFIRPATSPLYQRGARGDLEIKPQTKLQKIPLNPPLSKWETKDTPYLFKGFSNLPYR